MTPELEQKLAEENAHIPTDQIMKDINDTLIEIAGLQGKIHERESFVTQLRTILKVRASKP